MDSSVLVASLATGLFTIAGVAVTQRGERARRRHEADLHHMDRQHQHFERLLDERIRAYRKFRQALDREHETYGALRHRCGERPSNSGASDTDGPSSWAASVAQAVAAVDELRDAVGDVALVGSDAVAQQSITIGRLLERAAHLEEAMTEAPSDASWRQLETIHRDVDDERIKLLVAIREELSVERASALPQPDRT